MQYDLIFIDLERNKRQIHNVGSIKYWESYAGFLDEA